MKPMIALFVFLIAGIAHADVRISTSDLGVSLNSEGEPYAALVTYAKTVGAEYEVVPTSPEVITLTSKSNAGDANEIYLYFTLRDMSKPVSDDSNNLFCEGSLELVDDAWTFYGGCHL